MAPKTPDTSEGCVSIPTTTYSIKYPEGANRTTDMLSPVAAVDEEILLECAAGYVQVKLV